MSVWEGTKVWKKFQGIQYRVHEPKEGLRGGPGGPGAQRERQRWDERVHEPKKGLQV